MCMGVMMLFILLSIFLFYFYFSFLDFCVDINFLNPPLLLFLSLNAHILTFFKIYFIFLFDLMINPSFQDNNLNKYNDYRERERERERHLL